MNLEARRLEVTLSRGLMDISCLGRSGLTNKQLLLSTINPEHYLLHNNNN